EGATDADFADSREEAEQFRADDRAVIESGEPKHIPEESLTTADGERRILETTKIPYDPVDVDGDAVLGVSTDITELKEREAELEVQSAAMEASMDGISILNEDNEYIYMNRAHAAIFEYDADELLGNTWRRLYGDNEIARIEQDVFPVLEREGEWRGETVGQRRDGTPVHQEITLSMLEDGKLICTNRDITERKRREQELERKTTQLEAILQNTTTPMFLKNRDGEYLLSNREYRDVFGFEEGDVVGQTDHDLHPEAMADEVQQNDRLVLDRGESVEIEERIPATEEERIYITTKSPIYGLDAETSDDSPDAVFGVANDITERKERERKLRELKERLDLAVEGANLGVWDWDMQTDDVTFNEQWATMLGLSPDEIEPTLETWEERIHPADMDRVEAALEAHIAGETDLYDCEHRMQTASGDWKWIRDIGEVVERDDDGEPVRAVGIHLDITDQKETQTSLEEERDMFAEGPAVVFKWENEDGWPVEYVSDNVTETFGYTPTELETGEVPYADLIKADDLDRVAAEVEDNSDETTERFSHDPYRMVTANGDVKWVKDHTKIIRNEDEITHYLGYLIDITERKRLEQSIRESEQSIREVTQIAADTERDFQSKLDAILDLGCERLALPYGFLNRIDEDTQHVVEATGTHPLLQPGESAPLSKAYCRKTVEQDGVLDVTDAVEEGWGDDSAYETFGLGCYIGGQIVVDGETYGTLCFADDDSREHDFDETEQAFVELLVQWLSYELESDAVETKLRQLNETAQRMLAAEDHDEVGTIAIESAKSVLDMPVTGVWWYDEGDDTLVPAGMTDDATDVIDRQPRFQGEDSLAWQVFVDGEARLYDDLHAVEGLHNDGTDLRSEVIVPLGDHGVLLSGSTQQRAFSETDRSLLEVLSATVEAALSRAEREQELRKTRERLVQSNQELEQFAYAASHDLQEPLRTVSSYLTLLERRYSEDLSGDALEFVDIAVDGADRMREMIQALLEYSRVETRGDAFEPTDVSTVFDKVTRNLERTIDEAGATFDVPEDAGMVVGDESQLVQLFQNLVENGIKYSENQPSVEVSVTHRDGAIEYAVADDGIGMEPDQIDGIFEVFQRLHTREEFAGTGIGLSVCRKIVDRHDGDIRVESTPGRGSTFFITLPVEADTRA
ncbi:MAG: PAS domain S-box protein, partial [Halapricum sp.]